jgi:3-oxoacyl-[acyl-carrier-protein] synthase II
MKRQAVITGLGIVSPIGVGVEHFWTAACAGRSGISTPTLFDASKLPRECQIVGEVKDFNVRDWMPGAAGKMAGRFSQFAVAAAKMARDDSGLDESDIPGDRIKVAIGTSMSGQSDVGESTFQSFTEGDVVPPWVATEYPAHAATSHVAIAAGARGQAMTVATACAAGLDTVAWAAQEIRTGRASVVIAGATDTPLSEYGLTLFNSVGVLSRWPGPPEEASRPFDRWRNGLVLAEGCGVVIVEDEENARARGAPIYARILGYSSTMEAVHLRKVDETGEAVAKAITGALDNAKREPKDIDFVCAHGNSMQDYDAAETAGIKRALGRHAWNLAVSSLKSMCGQPLSAGSAMQVVATCMSIKNDIVSPTINHDSPDPRCDLDYVPNTARAVRVRTALILAHSLGGSHVAMILGAPE